MNSNRVVLLATLITFAGCSASDIDWSKVKVCSDAGECTANAKNGESGSGGESEHPSTEGSVLSGGTGGSARTSDDDSHNLSGVGGSDEHTGGGSGTPRGTGGTSGSQLTPTAGAAGTTPRDAQSADDGGASASQMPRCGDGHVDPGEACDGNCLTKCPPPTTPNACLHSTLTGLPSHCDVQCMDQPITSCVSGDGCCPSTCTHASDADCSAKCGDGVVDPEEKCEPKSASQPCPTDCDDHDPCTTDMLIGSAAACSAECVHEPSSPTNCFMVPAGWTAGAVVSSDSCPAGYDSPIDLKGGPSVQCSTESCTCGGAAQGSCAGSYTATIRDSRDATKLLQTVTAQADQSDSCTKITSTFGNVDTIAAPPLQWHCDTGSCDSCAPAGQSKAQVSWTEEALFCSLAAGAPSCGNGMVCPPSGAPKCVSKMGSQQCPSEYPDRKEFYSDATAACQCTGCGIANSASCATAKYAFVQGECPVSKFVDSPGNFVTSLPGTGGSVKVTIPTDSTEFYGGVIGMATPAICAPTKAERLGALNGNGLRTVCCQ